MNNDYSDKRMNENTSRNKPLNYKQVLSNPELAERIVSTHYHMGDFGYSGRKGCDTVRVLAESYGVSQNAVRETLKAAREGKLNDSYGNKIEAYSRKRTEDESQEVMELRAKGMSYNAIAKEMDRSKSFVYNIVKEQRKGAEKVKLAEERKQEIAYESKLAVENGSFLNELNAEAAQSYESYNISSPKKDSWFKRAKHYVVAAAAAGLLLTAGVANALSGSGQKGDTLEGKVAAVRTSEKKQTPILYSESSKREVFKEISIEEPRIENPVIAETPIAEGEISDIPLGVSYGREIIAEAPVGGVYQISDSSGKPEAESVPISDRPLSREEAIKPEPRPAPAPKPQPQPAPAVEGGLFAEKPTAELKIGWGYESFGKDVNGNEAKFDLSYSERDKERGLGFDARLNLSNKSESWKTESGDKAHKDTLTIHPTIGFDIKGKSFLFDYNHVESDKKLRNSSYDVKSYQESGFDISETTIANMEEKTRNSLDVFSARANLGRVKLFAEAGKNDTEMDNDTGMSTIVDISSLPSIVVNNDISAKSRSTTDFFRVEGGYDFGDVEAGAIFRHRATKWDAEAEANGSRILDESGSSKQNTLGAYGELELDNLKGRAILLSNSGDDLEDSQKVEAALNGNMLFGDKFVAGAGIERSDGGTKARGALFLKTNRDKTGKEALGSVSDYMNSAEDSNLFPDSMTREQRDDARMGRNMSAAADGLLLAIEGGKESVDNGGYFRADLGAPIPGTKGKAFAYGSLSDGDLERIVEGGVGVNLTKNVSVNLGYSDREDKENDLDQNSLDVGLKIKF